MKNLLLTLLLPSLLLSFCTAAFAEILPKDEALVFTKRLLPQPKSITVSSGEVFLDKTLAVNVELTADSPAVNSQTAALFKQFFNCEPVITVSVKETAPKEKDAYKITASGKTLTLSAADFSGIRYALYSLRQIADVSRNTEKIQYYIIPELTIEDSPAMKFRGIHICVFPETRFARVEQAVRLAAYYKFNYAVIECWGTFPLLKHSEFGWNEFKLKPEEIKHLVKISKELGITLIPQFNIFGHASGSRSISMKHSILDTHPEFQGLFEPDGWVWCLSNPATRQVLTDIVLEMYEAFDKPPFFHIGCDEANPPECPLCRKADYTKLLKEHMLYFHQLFAERNCRIMMWHDMLISPSNPDAKGYVANGSAKTAALAEELPKDIVVCDWQYSPPKENEQWKTMRYFKGLGYTVLACPWLNTSGIRSQGKTTAEAGLDGMLTTTWHHLSKDDFYKMLSVGGMTTWCFPSADKAGRLEGYTGVYPEMFGRHLRQINRDIPLTDYRDSGVSDWQLPKETAL